MSTYNDIVYTIDSVFSGGDSNSIQCKSLHSYDSLTVVSCFCLPACPVPSVCTTDQWTNCSAYRVASQRLQCYLAPVNYYCCGTCQSLKNVSRIGCEWGDRMSWCSSIPKALCYSVSTLCCDTCSAYKNSVQGEYTDHLLGY